MANEENIHNMAQKYQISMSSSRLRFH